MFRLLSLKQLLKNIPIGRGWFSKTALSVGGEAYKYLSSLSAVIGDWKQQLYDNRGDLFLLDATGTGLDFWGQDIQVDRYPGESDSSYRDRLYYRINETKLSVNGIKETILRETGISVDILLPWEYLDIKSYSRDNPRLSARSGSVRRPDNFWTSGTIQVISPQYDSRIAEIVDRLKAAHVRAYIKYNSDSVVEDDFQPEGGVSSLYFKEINIIQEYLDNPSSEDLNSDYSSSFFSSLDQNTHLFDDPYVNTSIWATSQTWKSIKDETWLTAINSGYDSLSDQTRLFKQTGLIAGPEQYWTETGQLWSDYYVWQNNEPAQIVEVPYWYLDQYETLTMDNYIWSPQ